MMKEITSRQNPQIKLIRSLAQRKQRQSQGLFVAEGLRHVGEAYTAGASITSLLLTRQTLENDYAQSLVTDLEAKGVEVLLTSPEILTSLTSKDRAESMLAVVRWAFTPLEEITPQTAPFVVALEAPQDPGNLGTILRSMDAAGANALLLLDNAVDPTHPSAVRASMGALFWIPLVKTDFTTFTQWASKQSYHITGTSAHATQDYRQISYPRPQILLMGSEREGLSTEQQAVCQQLVSLPMHGHATSLNLSIATSILLYEIIRNPQE